MNVITSSEIEFEYKNYRRSLYVTKKFYVPLECKDILLKQSCQAALFKFFIAIIN